MLNIFRIILLIHSMRGDTVHNIYPIVLPKVAIVMLYTLKEYI